MIPLKNIIVPKVVMNEGMPARRVMVPLRKPMQAAAIR
ncbi:unnamed protein product, partial [marine sediment metagenome]